MVDQPIEEIQIEQAAKPAGLNRISGLRHGGGRKPEYTAGARAVESSRATRLGSRF
ncbi:MAG: hypothetical protein GY698_02230 [Actinomycetia bacterium]|nr:hypothetical protein [Actinomycetes bacterium]